MPNLFFKGATSTQWNIFGGCNQQFKLKWCTAGLPNFLRSDKAALSCSLTKFSVTPEMLLLIYQFSAQGGILLSFLLGSQHEVLSNVPEHYSAAIVVLHITQIAWLFACSFTKYFNFQSSLNTLPSCSSFLLPPGIVTYWLSQLIFICIKILRHTGNPLSQTGISWIGDLFARL